MFAIFLNDFDVVGVVSRNMGFDETNATKYEFVGDF